jgi:hydrogenase-4 component F
MSAMSIFAILVIPLMGSIITGLMTSTRRMEIVYLLTAVEAFLAALWLTADVLKHGTVSWGDGFLYADSLGALVVLLTAFVYLVTAPYAIGYFRHDERFGAKDHLFGQSNDAASICSKLRKYYALAPLFAFCMFAVGVANNLGVMWVAVEGTTLASIFLVTFYARPTSLEAAWKYAILGGVGLSMALFGTVLTYYSAHQMPGSDSLSALNWSVLVGAAAKFDKPAMRLAFILVLLGYGTKAGLAPMHTWKPDAYSEAPVPVAVLMATAVLNCSLYALARFYVLTARCLGSDFASQLLIIFGLLTIGIAVPFILVQRSYRRLLAYSSIDHAGIMVLSLGFGGLLGPLGMLLHMTFHSVTKPLLFFCAGNGQQHMGNDSIRKGAGGMLHVLPVSGSMFLLAALAVTGTPPFSMFQSEFTVLRAGFAAQQTGPVILFAAFVVAIFCGLFYHVSQLVLGPSTGVPRGDFSPWKTYPVIGLAGVVVLLGFWLPAPLYSLVEGAARILVVNP